MPHSGGGVNIIMPYSEGRVIIIMPHSGGGVNLSTNERVLVVEISIVALCMSIRTVMCTLFGVKSCVALVCVET